MSLPGPYLKMLVLERRHTVIDRGDRKENRGSKGGSSR